MFYLLAFLNIIPLKDIFSSLASQRKFCFDLVSLFLGYEFEKGEPSSFHPQSTEDNPGFRNHQSCPQKTMTGLDFRLCGVFPERAYIFLLGFAEEATGVSTQAAP